MKSDLSRRSLLVDSADGPGSIALASILSGQGVLAEAHFPRCPGIDSIQPCAARQAHFEVRKEHCDDCVVPVRSQLGTFDDKPELIRRHGQPMPVSMPG